MTVLVHRVSAGTLSAALALAAGVVLAAPVQAKPLKPWWYTALHLDANHKISTGKGVKIAVIGQGLDSSVAELKGADVSFGARCVNDGTSDGTLVAGRSQPSQAVANHDTAMTALLVGQGHGNAPGGAGIVGVAPDATVRYFEEPTNCPQTADNRLWSRAIAWADIIAYPSENGAIYASAVKAVKQGVVLVAATGDLKDDNGVATPASEPGVVAVGAIDKNAKLWSRSPTGGANPTAAFPVVDAPGVDVESLAHSTRQGDPWASGYPRTGTSSATMIAAGELALTKAKYPTATGNQLIQQLIHTTGAGPSDPGYRFGYSFKIGFGTSSATNMLQTDPTGWPDINPLVDGPAAAERNFPSSIYGKYPHATSLDQLKPKASTSSKPTTSAASDESSSGTPAWAWIAAALMVVALAVAAAVAVLRRRTPSAEGDR